MNMKIELLQIPKYTSPNGYVVMYSAVNGQRSVYKPNGDKMTVINATSAELDEVYNLMKLADEHRNHKLALTPAHEVEENLPTQPTVITNSSQLVVGEHYADCKNKNFATVLEFVKTDRDKNKDYFKYVSGPKSYLHSEEDLITFPCDEEWHKIN